METITPGQTNSTAAGAPGFSDRYELMGELGRGGFGVVYKARQRNTGQLCALKTLHLEKASKPDAARRLLGRLEREMALIARLDSPHVVRLYDSGVTEHGHPFIALELVKGITLRQALTEGPLAPDLAIRLMAQILEALANAHDEGIVHRDLKPENIMVAARGGRLSAKVLDFGIASIAEESAAAGATLTLDKEVLGTPCYIAPEQIRSSKEAGPASDVYALGLILAELLTGKKAVTGQTVHMILARQLVTPVELPPELAASPVAGIIERATAKEDGERYLDASAMLAALEAIDADAVPALEGAIATTQLTELTERLMAEAPTLSGAVASPFAGTGNMPYPGETGVPVPGGDTATAEPTSRTGVVLLMAALALVIGASAVVLMDMRSRGADGTTAAEPAASSDPLSDEELEVDQLLARARDAKRDGRTEEAIDLYESVIARAPSSVDAREELGYTYLSLERFDAALEQFEAIASIDSTDAESETILLGRAIAQEGAGELQSARKSFETFVSSYPESQRNPEVVERLEALETTLDKIDEVDEAEGGAEAAEPNLPSVLTGGVAEELPADAPSDEAAETADEARERERRRERNEKRSPSDGDEESDPEVKRIGIFE